MVGEAVVSFTTGNETTPAVRRTVDLLNAGTVKMDDFSLGIVDDLEVAAMDLATKIKIFEIKKVFFVPATDRFKKTFFDH